MKKIINILFVAVLGLSLFACEDTANNTEKNESEEKVKEVMTAEEMKNYEKGEVIKELPEKEINNSELEKRGLFAVYVYEVTDKNNNGETTTQLTYTLKQHAETEEWENGEGLSEYKFIEIRVLEIIDYSYVNSSSMAVGGAVASCRDLPTDYLESNEEVWVKYAASEDEEDFRNEDGSMNTLYGFVIAPVENSEVLKKLENQE